MDVLYHLHKTNVVNPFIQWLALGSTNVVR